MLWREKGDLTSDGADVYNMQLSNEPAEELAQNLIASSKGAFEMVGFVSGGAYMRPTSVLPPLTSDARRLRGHGRRHQDRATVLL